MFGGIYALREMTSFDGSPRSSRILFRTDFNSGAVRDEIDSLGECGGDAVIDECGVCNGDGIDEGACDCAGNVLDCLGECGGDSDWADVLDASG